MQSAGTCRSTSNENLTSIVTAHFQHLNPFAIVVIFSTIKANTIGIQHQSIQHNGTS
jgi:phenylpyruvate tautomerase PptA (4-oxalocrotonate tautomerase family)